MQRREMIVLAAAAALAGCTTTPAQQAVKRSEIDAAVDNSLGVLYADAPMARDLAQRAQAVLVFPSVLSVGFIVGGTHGHGALRKGNQTLGYWSVAGGSVGLLAGAQSKAVYVFFMTPEVLSAFMNNDVWTAGGSASIVVVDAAAQSRITAQAPVLGIVRSQQGFMANLSLDGTRFARLNV